MRIISDPESWTGLRSPRAVHEDMAGHGETPAVVRGEGFAAIVRRMFRRLRGG